MADSPLWTRDEIVAATHGAATGADFAATGVTFDTRELQPGDLFVALTGERDGHDFAASAFARGAAGALVSRPVEGGPFVVVPDTLKALEALGAAARERADAKRVAVTGSVGKTSVTQALLASLKLAGPAHGSVKSFNNHIGVPLTLARMPRETRYAVFEIGMNHAGEIGPLSRLVKPHVAVVTNVGPVHTENFADGEAGVARAKAEIFEGLEPGGVAVLDGDGAWFGALSEAAVAAHGRVAIFGEGKGVDARLLTPSVASASPRATSPAGGGGLILHPQAPDGCQAFRAPPLAGELSAAGVSPTTTEGGFVRATLHGRPLDFPIAQRGAHWGKNSLAVLLALEAAGAPVEAGIAALAAFAPLAGRGAETRVPLPQGVFTLIDESYNANPISMRAAFDTLGRREGRKVAVLTDMLELGPDALERHAALAPALVAAKVDQVFAAGPLMRTLYEALPAALRGGWADTAADLAPQVTAAVRGGDVVMVKGSNGSKASLVVKALRELEA